MIWNLCVRTNWCCSKSGHRRIRQEIISSRSAMQQPAAKCQQEVQREDPAWGSPIQQNVRKREIQCELRREDLAGGSANGPRKFWSLQIAKHLPNRRPSPTIVEHRGDDFHRLESTRITLCDNKLLTCRSRDATHFRPKNTWRRQSLLKTL